MSDEKDNVVGINGNIANIKDAEDLGDTVERVKRLITPILGDRFVLMYYSEENIPSIIPSENLNTEELVFLGECLKSIAMMSMGIFGIE